MKRVGIGIGRTLILLLLVTSFFCMCISDALRNLKEPVAILELMVFGGALIASLFILRGCWRQIRFWTKVGRATNILLMFLFLFILLLALGSDRPTPFSVGLGYSVPFLFFFFVVCYQFTP